MTIIAYKAGQMAADSGRFKGTIRSISAVRKIVRVPGGGFIGVAGRVVDASNIRAWIEEGMPGRGPRFFGSEDDAPSILWVKPDGSVWLSMEQEISFFQTDEPAVVGERTAGDFCLGAMLAGMSAREAVGLAVVHCVWVAGPVQVEELGEGRI